MNILVIGNGFDLAHGLPTKYTDFLEFCKRVNPIFELPGSTAPEDYINKCLGDWNFNNQIIEALGSSFRSRRVPNGEEAIKTKDIYLNEMYNLIKGNLWIDYFLQNPIYQKENWIDFENEISKIIQLLNNNMHESNQEYNIDDIVYDFLKEKYSDYFGAVQPVNPVDNSFLEGVSFKKVRDKLLDDLNKFIRAFEIYLAEYVEKINCNLVSPDIQNILPKGFMKINGIPIYDLNVLSFNYTNTYQRLYIDQIEEYEHFEKYIDYIHGKADISNTIETNNMVLGIDEYLSDDRKNTDIEFIDFKKFYQRIYKETGSKYKDWLDIIKKDEHELKEKYGNEYPTQIPFKLSIGKHHLLYIFGHSLDITDQDVLRDLILNDNVKTIIFYRNREELRRKIANLVKIIHQEELIRRTGGSTKTIEFKLQQDMVPIED